MRRLAGRTLLAAGVLSLLFSVASPAYPQGASTSIISPEVFGAVSFGHLASCCRPLGDGALVGGGAGIRWRRLGIEGDVHRMLGLSPRELACAVQYGQTCLAGHEGARALTVASVNAIVTLARTRVEPYAAGGVGVLWSQHIEPDTAALFSGAPPVPPTAVILTEREVSDHGFVLNLGGGFRSAITGKALPPLCKVRHATSSHNHPRHGAARQWGRGPLAREPI